MAEFNPINQFGSAKPVRSGEGTSCAECEAMLMDALDGVLSAKEKAAFDRHIATCSECSQMLTDAKRGAALLEMLRSPRPEPSSALLERIISQTSGLAVPSKSAATGVIMVPAIDGAVAEIHGVVPDFVVPGHVLPFRPRTAGLFNPGLFNPGRFNPGRFNPGRFNLKAITQTMMQPRLAMTAAMAFFSITLTLNLTGVHLNDLKASDLTPSNLKHSFYHANASVVRYYDNLRVVYELESRVNELKRTNDDDNSSGSAKPAAKDDSDKNKPDGSQNDGGKMRKTPKSGSGTSERRSPWGQEFKLAGYGRSSPVRQSGTDKTEAGTGNTALARTTNKLKESLQEGDLV